MGYLCECVLYTDLMSDGLIDGYVIGYILGDVMIWVVMVTVTSG